MTVLATGIEVCAGAALAGMEVATGAGETLVTAGAQEDTIKTESRLAVQKRNWGFIGLLGGWVCMQDAPLLLGLTTS